MKKTYSIDVDCVGCAGKMETAAAKTPGVVGASVNFMAQKLTVEFAEGQDPVTVMAAVRRNCRKATGDGEIYL